MSVIPLPHWYQIDFLIQGTAKTVLTTVASLIEELKKEKLISKWFFLYENDTIRIRFKASDAKALKKVIDSFIDTKKLTPSPKLPFGGYEESSESFDSEDSVETFANIMSELSDLSIKRLSNPETFEPYKLLERLTHCIFNNIYGTNTEIYSRLKMLGVDFGSKDNPNQTALDENQKYIKNPPVTIPMPLPEIIIPAK